MSSSWRVLVSSRNRSPSRPAYKTTSSSGQYTFSWAIANGRACAHQSRNVSRIRTGRWERVAATVRVTAVMDRPVARARYVMLSSRNARAVKTESLLTMMRAGGSSARTSFTVATCRQGMVQSGAVEHIFDVMGPHQETLDCILGLTFPCAFLRQCTTSAADDK